MRWILVFVLMTTSLAFAVQDGHAQSPGVFPKAGEAVGVGGPGGIVTAVDVAELWNAGRSDADIATSLSAQRGYDRQAALKKGLTDEQIVEHLIVNPTDPSSQQADVGKSGQHKAAGDKYSRESQYGKAATEYTRAIEFSRDSHELYLMRAESYRQYLKTTLNPAIQSNPDKARQGSMGKSRALLCHALYADYETAARISKQKKADSYAELKAMQANLGPSAPSDQANDNIALYHKRAARNIQGTRQMQTKYYEARKNAERPGFTMEQVMKDYKGVCDGADSATR